MLNQGKRIVSNYFIQAASIIWAGKLLGLFLTTPLYDLDTNSYIRGGFTWDIYHNPFMNLFIAVFGKIWSNAWFIVSIQCLIYALAGAFLIQTLTQDRRNAWWWALLGIVLLEPLTAFYNYSLLAESSFTAFTLVSVAAAIRYLRVPHPRWALLFGLGLGLTFLCKLSALIHLPLFLIFLFRGPFIRRSVPMGLLALLPFVGCYLFVYVGQKKINEGDLYTVEGRVRWDFSSALYNPEEVEGDEFKRYVHPYILEAGKMEMHRERRRELSYLGYKDCVADYEARGRSANEGINACDSIFGAVAQQIMDQHFWAAEKQFIRDNFRFIHELNYIDYRFTPDLHYYYPDHEWQYLDSLMRTHYAVDLSENQARIPEIWTSLSFGNVYMPVIWWLWWGFLIGAAIFWWRDRSRWELLVIAGLVAIPIVFHFVYISYRPRFLAPYLVLVWSLGMLILQMLTRYAKD